MASAPSDFEQRLDAVERLVRLFLPERVICMVANGAGLLLLVYVGIKMIQANASIEILGGIFGSAGLMTYSTARLFYVFNRVTQIIDPQGSPAAKEDKSVKAES